jgi:hypothetical protein
VKVVPVKDTYTVTLDLIKEGHSGYARPIMKKKHPVILSETERDDLKSLIASGTAPARKLTHARILLKADQSPGSWPGGRGGRGCGGGESAYRL